MSTSGIIFLVCISVVAIILSAIQYVNKTSAFVKRSKTTTVMIGHPLEQKGEVLLYYGSEKLFERTPWKTKRKGFFKNSKRDKYFAIFVQEKELRDAGYDLQEVYFEIY